MYQGKFTANSKSRRKSTSPAPSPALTTGGHSGKRPVRRHTKKRPTPGTVVFYAVYALVMLLLVAGIAIGMGSCNSWLVRYESSQPDAQAQQIFDAHFSNPDWKDIYEMAKLQDTAYENSASFVSYMQQQGSADSLTYVKTSAGLSGGHKYIVRMDDLNIATFTLQNKASTDLDIPSWELEEIQVMLTRNEHVLVYAAPDQTVSLNGVAVPKENIVLTTSTVAEDYLPSDLHGHRTVLYRVDDLLIAPEVTVTNSDGSSVEMVYDAQTKTYTLPAQTHQLPDGLEERMVSAVQNYCRHMIGAGGSLSSYFDTSSQIYKTITRNELWFRGYTGYEFTPAEVLDAYVYSDTVVSAKVCLDLNVSRSNGTIKTFTMDSTLFMQKQNGKWMIIDMVNVDVQQQRTQVRLVCSVDGEIIYDEMVDGASRSLSLPQVTVPNGKVFAGWFRQTVDDSGKQTLKLMFQPDDSGKVSLPDGYLLEPMELIARFEKQEE